MSAKYHSTVASTLTGLLIALLSISPTSLAVTPYNFTDEHERQRYQQIIEELRCPKCQNQAISDSDAPIAKDLRDKVFQMIRQGKSYDEIIAFMEDRYGDFVLYKPRFSSNTYLLWLGPPIMFILGLVVLVTIVRQQAKREAARTPLSDDEAVRLATIKKLDDIDG